MESDKITITTADFEDMDSSPRTPVACVPPIPLWWRLLSALLILCPPVLFIVTIVGLTTLRRRDLLVRHAYTVHYCCLLLASGIIWTLVAFALAIWMPSTLLDRISVTSTLSINTFPQLPSDNILSGKDIARQLSPLVVVVHHAGHHALFSSDRGGKQACGAGALALATHDGYLLVTSRHVVDALSGRSGIGEIVGVTLQDGQEAHATVVGIHRSLDLALLWVPRKQANTEYVQPIRSFKTIEVGEQVFVIGHPEGLEFSISSGLIAQKRGTGLIQMSAPVSPGNSGGPVYDTNGRLLAIVQSVFDKTKRPNAENLNFAVRVDDLLNSDVWILAKKGHTAIASLSSKSPSGSNRTYLPETKR